MANERARHKGQKDIWNCAKINMQSMGEGSAGGKRGVGNGSGLRGAASGLAAKGA